MQNLARFDRKISINFSALYSDDAFRLAQVCARKIIAVILPSPSVASISESDTDSDSDAVKLFRFTSGETNHRRFCKMRPAVLLFNCYECGAPFGRKKTLREHLKFIHKLPPLLPSRACRSHLLATQYVRQLFISVKRPIPHLLHSIRLVRVMSSSSLLPQPAHRRLSLWPHARYSMLHSLTVSGSRMLPRMLLPRPLLQARRLTAPSNQFWRRRLHPPPVTVLWSW